MRRFSIVVLVVSIAIHMSGNDALALSMMPGCRPPIHSLAPAFARNAVNNKVLVDGPQATVCHMSSVTEDQETEVGESIESARSSAVPIHIIGNNINVTPTVTDFVHQRLGKIFEKLAATSGNARECEVHLSMNKNPKVEDSHRVEVVTAVKGTTIRVCEDSPHIFRSVDLVAKRLERKLRQYKERRLRGHHGGKTHLGENMLDFLERSDEEGDEEKENTTLDADADIGSDSFVDPEEPVVTKIKSFDLSKPVSLREAVFSLDYLDHDFFVFRDEESKEVNVVYKRNAGGVGLIQPSP